MCSCKLEIYPPALHVRPVCTLVLTVVYAQQNHWATAQLKGDLSRQPTCHGLVAATFCTPISCTVPLCTRIFRRSTDCVRASWGVPQTFLHRSPLTSRPSPPETGWGTGLGRGILDPSAALVPTDRASRCSGYKQSCPHVVFTSELI